jgi:hypothetical protein
MEPSGHRDVENLNPDVSLARSTGSIVPARHPQYEDRSFETRGYVE